VRIGRYGPFLTDGTHRSSLPDGLAPDELTLEKAVEILHHAAKGPEALGKHPENDLPVYLKKGRFGPYIQLGENGTDGERPQMASLLPGMKPEDVDLELALKLLSLPRNLGKNPENNEDIIAANGRYGPYIKCGSDTRSIPMDEMSPLDISLGQALELFKQPKTRGRGNLKPKTLRDIGAHPTGGSMITVKSGRYGPYVTDGKINASIPKEDDPAALTIEQAVSLLERRAAAIEAGGGVRRGRRTKAAARSAKKATPKASTSKKTKKKS